MADPRVPQGNLNRLRASVIWATFPALNVTPSFLGQGGIGLSFDGDATARLPQMTGIVNSPEPFQGVTLTINLIKSQSLSQQYEEKRLTDSLMGDCTVRPDVSSGGLGPFELLNMSIANVAALSFSGAEAGYVVTLGGYYLINSDLWNG